MDDEAHGPHADAPAPAPTGAAARTDGSPAERSSSRSPQPEGLGGEEPSGAGERAGLDPRAVAAAAPAPGNVASLWWVAAGVTGVTAVSLLLGTQVGVWCLAALMAGCAAVRAMRPPPGPAALSVRFRTLDVVVLATFAVTLAVLGSILPAGARIV